jgi:type II secretion system protein G
MTARSQKGFTLIELLIVIAIIGILATMATVTLGSSQRRARDGQRKSDLKQVAVALEQYYNSNSAYPSATAGAISGASWGGSWANYLRTVPRDPIGGTEYCYESSITGAGTAINTYALFARLENTNDSDRIQSGDETCNGIDYVPSGGAGYRLDNPF